MSLSCFSRCRPSDNRYLIFSSSLMLRVVSNSRRTSCRTSAAAAKLLIIHHTVFSGQMMKRTRVDEPTALLWRETRYLSNELSIERHNLGFIYEGLKGQFGSAHRRR